MSNIDYSRRDSAKVRRMDRRAARRFKAARQLAWLAFGVDDSAIMGGR